jgi:hypothetical protein
MDDEQKEVILEPNYENTAKFAAEQLRLHGYTFGAAVPVISFIEQIRYLTQKNPEAVQRIIDWLARIPQAGSDWDKMIAGWERIGQVETDNDGQYVIYTGVYEEERPPKQERKMYEPKRSWVDNLSPVDRKDMKDAGRL